MLIEREDGVRDNGDGVGGWRAPPLDEAFWKGEW